MLTFFCCREHSIETAIDIFVAVVIFSSNEKCKHITCMWASGKARKHGFVVCKVSKVAKIRNRYNQVPHLTQDTNEYSEQISYIVLMLYFHQYLNHLP